MYILPHLQIDYKVSGLPEFLHPVDYIINIHAHGSHDGRYDDAFNGKMQHGEGHKADNQQYQHPPAKGEGRNDQEKDDLFHHIPSFAPFTLHFCTPYLFKYFAAPERYLVRQSSQEFWNYFSSAALWP